MTLGGAAFVPGEKGDGIDLAKRMAKYKIHVDTPTIVHSMNFPASENIVSMLKPTHKNLFRIDYFNLRELILEQILFILGNRLKPFYRGE